jgi:signal transduction histidine kinase/CheY-like chemotaxis protein
LNLHQRPDQLTHWLNTIQASIPEYTWIGLTDQQGVVRASTGNLLLGQNVQSRDWFQSARQKPVSVDVHDAKLLERYLPKRDHNQEPWRFVDVAAPVITTQGQMIGVLGAHLSWDWLVNKHQHFLESLTTYQNADVIVAAADGSIRLVGPDFPQDSLAGLPSFQRAKAGEAGWVKERWPNGKEYMVGFAPNPGFGAYHQLGWVTLVRLPAASVSGLMTPAIEGIWKLFAAAVLICVVGIWFLTQMTLMPVRNLVYQIKATTRQGGYLDLSQAMPAEFTVLGESANQLIEVVEKRDSANLAKTQFMADLSHELRTPLNGIMGYGHLLLPRLQDPQDQHDLNAMLTSATNMASMLDQILELSMIEEGEIHLRHEAFSLNELVNATTALASLQVQAKNLRLDVNKSYPQAISLIGDPVRISQIVNNLVTNAIKFTAQGSVQLAIKTTVAQSGLVQLEIDVRDTGIGLEEHQLSAVFGRFHQARTGNSSRAAGSGLGLAITAGLVNSMQGTITLDSKPNQGSHFKVVLPLAVDYQKAVTKPTLQSVKAPAIQHKPQRRLSVLVVDDMDTNRDILVRWLELQGHAVTESATSQNAVIKAGAQRFDLILMDVDLPEMNGWEATQKIRASNGPSSNAVIFAISGHAYGHDIAASEAAGMNGHLSKPIDFKALQKELNLLN